MTPVCPACSAKFAHDGFAMRCKKCGLPDEVRDAGTEAIAAWHEQMLVLRKQFGAMHARQQRAERKKQVRHPSRSAGGKAPVNTYRKLARLKRAG